ncbi:hypothetical protein GCM10020367_11810 [Streptomyces sannanensis]|uniref:FAD:protein FMN transferase n=2 Tax=Streptomyces sannanensis TaxID=285536 RepID=A0ABP6S6S0_9ACTN
MLHEAGAPDSYVNGGGDIRLGGAAAPGLPHGIGITGPVRRGRLLTVVSGRDFAVATSGTGERGAHILDPRSGVPARGLLSVTVVGPSLTWAGTYATAAIAMGERAKDWIASVDGYELLIADHDAMVWSSDGFARWCEPAGGGPRP